MSQSTKVILGALAVSLACGAVQFASGQDLTTVGLRTAGNSTSAPSVNRAVKADRDAVIRGAGVATRTIAIRVDRLPDTSVVVRIPQAQEAQTAPSVPSVFLKSNEGKPAVACEPAVSVLTEIAKRLQPGRCIT